MKPRIVLFTAILTSLLPAVARAQNQKPILRLEAGGPTSNVTALAFSPDGNTLYAAGFDKVVRVWRINKESKEFELDPKTSFRVPIHPGTQGAINAMALSSDGQWLAVGGLGIFRKGTDFGGEGKLWPELGTMDLDMRQDQGLIHVFNTRKQQDEKKNEIRILRGHRGPVLTLDFAAVKENQPLLLASAAQGWDFANGKRMGEVMLWDVDKSEQVAELNVLPPAPNSRPGLAVFSTGPKAIQAGVAIAWGDEFKEGDGPKYGLLRLWHPATKSLKSVKDGYGNTTVLLFPDGKRLLTGSFKELKGHLQVWNIVGVTAEPDVQQVTLTVPAMTYNFPQQLAFFSERVEGAPDHVAVVVRQLKGSERENLVELIDVSRGNFGKRKVKLPLPNDLRFMPTIAGSAQGRFLAVAAKPDYAIDVHFLSNLINLKIQPQVLHSAGMSFQFVHFANNAAGKLGLALAPDPRDQPSLQAKDLIFDFEGREVKSVKGWKITEALNGWQLDPPVNVNVQKDNNGKTIKQDTQFTVKKNGKPQGTPIVLAGYDGASSWSLSPPRAPWNVPLVAVAVFNVKLGEPLLFVYNAQTGQKLRKFAGHFAKIRELDFSPDGKLLASVGDDQTVNIWSLTDYVEVFNKFGGIEGLEVEKKDKNLTVLKVSPSAAATGLQPGQVILGEILEDKTKLKSIETPFAFYQTLWKSKPGNIVNLRVLKAGEPVDIKLPVEQGIDVRKPLFSLFIAQTKEWIGWNATGPFDSSGNEVERFVGWHFNPGLPKEPARFAVMGQYRKEYYRKNIIKHLVAQTNLAAALKTQHEEENPPPEAREVPHIQDGVGAIRAGNGDLVFRNPKDTVQFEIHKFKMQEGDVIDWQLDGGKANVADPPDGNTWAIPLAKFANKPGQYKFRFNLRLLDSNKQVIVYSRDLTVRYQTPAPRVALIKDADAKSDKKPELQRVASKAAFSLEAFAHAAILGHKVIVAVTHKNNGKEIAAKQFKPLIEPGQPFEIKEALTLQEGINRIEVMAENVERLAGFDEDERDRLTLDVQYNPKAPSILIREVTPLADKIAGEPLVVKRGQIVAVDLPRVRIAGLIQAEEDVQPPEFDLGPNTERKKILVKGAVKELPFQFDVDLQVGDQQFRVFASIGKGNEVNEAVAISYRPRLAQASISADVDKVRGDKDEGEVAVRTKLYPPTDTLKHKLTVEYLVNDKVKAKVEGVDSTVKELPDIKMLLQPGNNLIQVRLSNKWNSVTELPGVAVRYMRPPQITDVKTAGVGDKPFVNLAVQVKSAVPPLAESVVALIDGNPTKSTKPVVQGKAPDWTIQVAELPLPMDPTIKEAKFVIEVLVANAEDQSEKFKANPFTYKRPPEPPPPPPVIALEAAEVTLKEPEHNVKFQVKSAKPLKRLEVVHGAKVVFAPDLAKAKLNAQGAYEFETGILPLDWGINRLQVEAVNDGGPANASQVITVPPWPVQLDLDQLVVEEGKEETVTPTHNADRTISFPRTSDGRVRLVGKVRWSSKDDANLKGAHKIRLYVNGFQQLPIDLMPAEKGERARKFEARLSLPSGDNHVELLLPDLKSDANNRLDFSVACAKPMKGQQVHVVIVAPGETDEKELKEKFRKAFASKQGQDFFRTTLFDGVRLYTMADYVPPIQVHSRLATLSAVLKSRAAQGYSNDIVLVYYSGKQSEYLGQSHLWTSETEPGALRGTSLVLNELKDRYFDRFAGAQVLLLDLYPDKQGAVPRVPWQSDFRFGVLGVANESKTSLRNLLLGELENTMPSANSLADLSERLRGSKNLGPSSFRGEFPRTLRMQLNPMPATGTTGASSGGQE